jgi:hypothetical protein
MLQPDLILRRTAVRIHASKGELLLRQGNSNVAEVQSVFNALLRLRASKAPNRGSCARPPVSRGLLAKQRRRDEARAMLAEIYGGLLRVSTRAT